VDFDAQGAPFFHPPLQSSEEDSLYSGQIVMRHAFGLRDIKWAVKRDLLRLTGRHRDRINTRYHAAGNPERRARAMEFLLNQMAAAAQKMGAHLGIVYIPSMDALGPAPQEFAAAAAGQKRKSFFYLDLTEDFRAYAAQHGERGAGL
jgi:hypothetical protein